MSDFVAWVEVGEYERGGSAVGVARYYVTHGLPFMQLTAFRTAAARYGTEEVAQKIADFAADPGARRGVEQIPKLVNSP